MVLAAITKYEERALKLARVLGRRMQAYSIAKLNTGKMPRPSALFFAKQVPLLTELMVVANLRGRIDAHKAARGADANYNVSIELASEGPIFDKTIEIMRKTLGPGINLKALEAQYNIVALRTLSNVSDTIEKDIRATAYGLIERGATVKEAKVELGKRFDALGLTPRNSFQLETIFRTASSVAYGAGSWVAYQDPDIQEILWGYQYTAVMDDRTRENHAAAEGVTLPKDDEFWQRMWPPNGYNCILPGQKVQGRFNLGYKIWYNGEYVEIVTSKGNRLSVTVNHPILTQRGFVPAGLLDCGDYAVSYESVDWRGSSPIELDEYRPEATVEDATSALQQIGNLSRVHARPDALYGDCKFGDGYIDVVTIQRELRDDFDPFVAERFSKFNFPLADDSSFRVGAGDQSVFGVDAAAPSFPSRTALLDDIYAISPANYIRFGHASQLDASIYQDSVDRSTVNAKRFTERIRGLSRQIAFDKIIKIRRGKFSGHVYDFQSEGGWIVAEGLMIRNCRCEVIPIFSREPIQQAPPEAVADPGFGYNPGIVLDGLRDTTGVASPLPPAPTPKPLPSPALEPPEPPSPIDIVEPARIPVTEADLQKSVLGEGPFTVPTEEQQLTWVVGEKWNPVTRQYDNAHPDDIAAQVAPYAKRLSAQTGLSIQPEVVINTPPATLQEWAKGASAMVTKFSKILENVKLFNVNRSDPKFRGYLERQIPRGQAYRYEKRVDMLAKRADELRREMIDDIQKKWSAKIDDPERNGAQATIVHELGHQIGYELERENAQDYNTWAMDWARAEQATKYVSKNFSEYAGWSLTKKGFQSFRAELTAESHVEMMFLAPEKWSRITKEYARLLEKRGYDIH